MKKKIFGITLAVCILVLSIASTTIAYFTDTDAQTQVFTAGNVEIDLTCINNIFEDSDNREKMSLYPGQELVSDSTIVNTGSEEAYVGAIITFSNNAIADNFDSNHSIKDLFGWQNGVDTKYAVDGNTCKIYVVYPTKLAAGASVKLFDKITIPVAWDNDEMEVFRDLTITISAYATQTFGFDNATVALKTAFNAAEAWGSLPNQ